jgi:tetratricopeptide (TPR) repeat protein
MSKVAHDVSFKMYHLLSQECSISECDMANELRYGLNFLSDYVSWIDNQGLDKALEKFRKVRRKRPNQYEAHYYEGIALELLERHDEAAMHLKFVKENCASEDLQKKAAYNEAITYLRIYEGWKNCEKAIDLLNEIIPKGDTKILTPIQALAKAAKADAVAFKPKFWRSYPPKLSDTEDLDLIVKQKDYRRWIVDSSISEVKSLTSELTEIINLYKKNEMKNSGWDDLAITQLEWAVNLSIGDLYLNCAENFFCEPYPKANYNENKRDAFFAKAENAFRKCQMLLTPGAEIFSCLGTVSMFRGKLQEAQNYLEKAISLHKYYEYAYYRLSQVFDKQDISYKVIETLKRFEKPSRISGFQGLCEKYHLKHL